MMPNIKQYPFYIKSTVVLLGLTLLCIALFTLKEILAPIAFSMIVPRAMARLPMDPRTLE